MVNAGGIINIAGEFAPEGYNEESVRDRTQSIPRALKEIFRIAKEQGVPTSQAADRLARERIDTGRSKAV